jgi:hypothetical protein
LAMSGPKAFVVYLWDGLSKPDYVVERCSSLPELTIARLVDFPCSENRHVSSQGSLHNISLFVENPSLSGNTRFQNGNSLRAFTCRSESDRNVTALDGGI